MVNGQALELTEEEMRILRISHSQIKEINKARGVVKKTRRFVIEVTCVGDEGCPLSERPGCCGEEFCDDAFDFGGDVTGIYLEIDGREFGMGLDNLKIISSSDPQEA